MKAAICVPWRGGVPSREKVWEGVRLHDARSGLPVSFADSDDAGPFNRSEARNRAAEALPDMDVYAFLDADAYLPTEVLLASIDRAHATQAAIYPYSQLLSMNPVTGEGRPRVNFVRNNEAPTGPSDAQSPLLISGNVIVPRALYARVGGWDERFTGYGWEDGAFLRMLRLLGIVEMVEGSTLVCIEHTRTEDENPNFSITIRPEILADYDAAENETAALALAATIREYREARRAP